VPMNQGDLGFRPDTPGDGKDRLVRNKARHALRSRPIRKGTLGDGSIIVREDTPAWQAGCGGIPGALDDSRPPTGFFATAELSQRGGASVNSLPLTDANRRDAASGRLLGKTDGSSGKNFPVALQKQGRTQDLTEGRGKFTKGSM